MKSRRLGALALALLALGAVAATPVGAQRAGSAAIGERVVTLGIGDQKPAMFGDPLFQSLSIRKARIVVPWDVMVERWSRDQMDEWMDAAHAAGVRPLVAFGHSRRPGLRRMLPSADRMRQEFLKVTHRYPWLREVAAWNEPNHCGEPTCRRPELVAHYYDQMRTACPRCTVLGAEVLDMPNMVKWVKRFRRTAKVDPKVWGLHNYIDANRLRTSGTRRLLSATHGQIWFTETGGIVRRGNPRKTGGFEESPRHAAVAVRWVFDRLVPLSRRITRVYLYHWTPVTNADYWDSALLGPTGTPRPAFDVLRHMVRIQAAVRARALKARKARHPR